MENIQGTFAVRLNTHAIGMTRLAGTNFSGSRMLLASFAGVDLQGAVMADAHLPSTRFDSAMMYGVDFSDSKMVDADLFEDGGCRPVQHILDLCHADRRQFAPDKSHGHRPVRILQRRFHRVFAANGADSSPTRPSMRSPGQPTQARREQ